MNFRIRRAGLASMMALLGLALASPGLAKPPSSAYGSGYDKDSGAGDRREKLDEADEPPSQKNARPRREGSETRLPRRGERIHIQLDGTEGRADPEDEEGIRVDDNEGRQEPQVEDDLE